MSCHESLMARRRKKGREVREAREAREEEARNALATTGMATSNEAAPSTVGGIKEKDNPDKIEHPQLPKLDSGPVAPERYFYHQPEEPPQRSKVLAPAPPSTPVGGNQLPFPVYGPGVSMASSSSADSPGQSKFAGGFQASAASFLADNQSPSLRPTVDSSVRPEPSSAFGFPGSQPESGISDSFQPASPSSKDNERLSRRERDRESFWSRVRRSGKD